MVRYSNGTRYCKTFAIFLVLGPTIAVITCYGGSFCSFVCWIQASRCSFLNLALVYVIFTCFSCFLLLGRVLLCVFIDITTKYGDLWCFSVVVWLHGGCMLTVLVVGEVELCSVYMFFRVFQIILLEIFALCVSISLCARLKLAVPAMGPSLWGGTEFIGPARFILPVIFREVLREN